MADVSNVLSFQLHSLHELMGHSKTEEMSHHAIHSAVEVSIENWLQITND